MRLHTKIILLIVCVSMSIGSLSAIISGNILRYNVTKELEQRALVIAQTMSEHITHNVVASEAILVQEALQQVVRDIEEVEYAYVYDFGHDLFAHSFKGNFPKALLKKHQNAFSAGVPLLRRYQTGESLLFDVSYPLINGLIANIHIGVSENNVYRQAAILRNQIFGFSFAITLLGICIGIVLSRHFTYPLSTLAKTMDIFGEGQEFETSRLISGSVEINMLNDSFKRMIIERKKAEKLLQESKEKILLLLNSTGEAIYGLDMEGNCTFCNPSCLRLLGYEDESQLLSRNMHVLIHHTKKDGTSYPEEKCHIYQAFREGKGTHVDDEVFWRADGTSFASEYRSFPIFMEGKTMGSVVSFVDITERKQMEEALLQSEKLKSLGTITAGVSHEFNNILAIITGNVQLLEGSRKNDEELTKALCTIKRVANDGAKISKRMLKFTKIDKDTTGFVSFDINELINQAIDFTMPRWKNMAQAKGINYHMDTEGMKRVPSILCNPTELREVFVNIINNALDAMSDGGRVSFSTWSSKDTVFISVSDTGEGMSEEVKKNIFDPFFTTKIAVGTGLGMSTAYGIITRHGGKIEVESKIGKGTIFTLQFLIATNVDSPKESPEQEQEIKANCLRILVVDDEEAICDILDKFFSKKGHLVRTVDNGREAIILAKATDYDLVLTDLAMPNVYGYDVIKALNKLEKRPKIGIITGWCEKLKSIDDEDFIIKKPFDFSELTKNINDVIGAE